MISPHEAINQIFRKSVRELRWIPLPLEDVGVDEVVIFGNGKDCDLILSPSEGYKIKIPVSDVKLITPDGAMVESKSWGDISRTVRVTGRNLSIRRAAVGWPGEDEEAIAELEANVRVAFQPIEYFYNEEGIYRERGELGFAVDVELELCRAS